MSMGSSEPPPRAPIAPPEIRARGMLGLGGGYQIITRRETFVETAASFLGHKLLAFGDAGPLSLGLSGGSTPGPVYERLASVPDLRWSDVHVFFADERGVPPDHPDSNYALARRCLLDAVPVPEAQVHRMQAEREDIDAAAREYEAELPLRLDLLVLGIGADGHTASLFPGAATNRELHRRVLPATAPVEPVRRMTVTPLVIAAARLIVVLACGESKAEAVRVALTGGADLLACPARIARHGVWIMDREAMLSLSADAGGASLSR